MARKLPWERKGALPQPSSRRRSSSPGPAAATDSPRADAAPASPSRSAERRAAVARRFRSPSTSPPPAPPVESFMIDGMDHDDQYRMVEDEFLSVAHTFTAHLHAAEYQRLKAWAMSQSAEAIRSLSRPVTGAPTDAVLRKHETKRRIEKQRRGLRRAFANGKAEEEEDDKAEAYGDAPWTGTSLQNLMEGSPRKGRLVPLASLVSRLQKKGRDEEEEDDEEDEDDLDGPPTSRRAPETTARTAVSRPLPPRKTQKPFVPIRAGERTAASVPRAGSRATVQETAPSRDDSDDGDDDDMLDDLDAGDLLHKIRQRRERERARRRQQQRHGREDAGTQAVAKDSRQRLDTIPSFL